MRSKPLAALTVAVLLLTAGCSFLGGNGTPGASPDGSPGDPAAGSFEYPAGYEASGVTAADAAVTTHEDAITSLDSYTMTYNATVDTSQSTVFVNYSQRADLADERALVRSRYATTDQFYGSRTQFYTADTLYVRSDQRGSNNTRYGNVSRQFNASELVPTRFVRPMLTNVTYGEAEVVTRSGVRLAKYESESLDNSSAIRGDTTGAAVENFSATVWVDDSGVVRRVVYETTVVRNGEERSLRVVVDVSAVGETDVARPDWISKA